MGDCVLIDTYSGHGLDFRIQFLFQLLSLARFRLYDLLQLLGGREAWQACEQSE